MRLFLMRYKIYDSKEEWYALTFAKDEQEALQIAGEESNERFGIRKSGAHDFRIIGELKKPALLLWAEWNPCELDDEEFSEVNKEGKEATT